tara:strand:- start:687 stop:824 length:138 start_codon:yes stop_codon:yes gene_type:complete
VKEEIEAENRSDNTSEEERQRHHEMSFDHENIVNQPIKESEDIEY